MKKNTCSSTVAILCFVSLLLLSADSFAASNVPIPTKDVIAKDLVGRKLSEGTDNGYFTSDWSWTIEQGQISNLTILSKSVTEDYCSFVVVMTLKRPLSPIRYNATVQVDYSLENKKWKPLLVKSKGVKVVNTGKYFDCISSKIDKSGWRSCLIIKNNIDSPLLVGLLIRKENSSEWEKFSVTIDGLKEVMVGAGYGGVRAEVIDYRIHFVELY